MRRLVCLVLFVTLGGLAPANGLAGEGRSDLPNVVVILTDDQRWDTLWSMPTVQSELIGHGIEFTNGFVVNPLCCPSRASLITGQYSHTHGVYTNAGPYGGFQHFAGDDSTIATWLHDGGYWTGFVGKYLNGYRPQDGYIPPGWDRWVAMNLGYYNYWLNIDGVPAYFGSDPEDYSTDVLGADAASFIRDSPTDQPLLLDFAPYAPHGPATPSVTYQDAFSDLPPWRAPSYNEKD